MGIVLPAFFIFVIAILALAGMLGFTLSLFLFRQKLLLKLTTAEGSERAILVLVIVGIGLSILIPLVGGIAYALSGASWMTAFFGKLGEYYWVWAAATFSTGLVIGCTLRAPALGSDQNTQTENL